MNQRLYVAMLSFNSGTHVSSGSVNQTSSNNKPLTSGNSIGIGSGALPQSTSSSFAPSSNSREPTSSSKFASSSHLQQQAQQHQYPQNSQQQRGKPYYREHRSSSSSSSYRRRRRRGYRDYPRSNHYDTSGHRFERPSSHHPRRSGFPPWAKKKWIAIEIILIEFFLLTMYFFYSVNILTAVACPIRILTTSSTKIDWGAARCETRTIRNSFNTLFYPNILPFGVLKRIFYGFN